MILHTGSMLVQLTEIYLRRVEIIKLSKFMIDAKETS